MYGTDHCEFRIRQRDRMDALPDVLESFDERFADSSRSPVIC
jgi:hypothetical protein